MMEFGRYTLHAIETGMFALDGGAMFGVVPRIVWERRLPAGQGGGPVDERHRVSLSLRCLLAIDRDSPRRILIDTGIGTKGDAKFNDIYRIDHTAASLERSLKRFDLCADDITDVILTHLHFDHAGGATMRSANGDIVPAFPNATYYVQKKNFAWAMKPTEKDRASYLQENFLPLKDAGRLTFLGGEREIFPGIHLLLFEGHTAGQQLPLLRDGKESLFFCADLFPTSAHIPLPWIMAYDNHPLVTLEEKRALLARAARENWILFFEHCPCMAAATVRKNERGFAIEEEIRM